ncbi:hypothetical protein TNCT_680191 [Trichonephila clavata]|uniref:Uncharacterized protein n=1 Tax=Trichonephila clavata TaxID=2740835 RepID=A0A8X6JJV5_TRICU|nr:hypothetical protein TNCT_680191 [Trichonephila clavata]
MPNPESTCGLLCSLPSSRRPRRKSAGGSQERRIRRVNVLDGQCQENTIILPNSCDEVLKLSFLRDAYCLLKRHARDPENGF